MKLPNGYGTVYKLSGKRRRPYVVKKTVGWEFDETKNKMVQKTITLGYFATRAEGLKVLSEYNDNPYDLNLSIVTFEEIYKRWFEDTFDDNSNKSTVRNYETAFKHCASLHKMKMADIRPMHMQKVLDETEGGYQTIKRIHTLFNKLYKWCMAHDCIKKNYAEQTKISVKSDTKPRNAFSSEEVDKLWSLQNESYIPIVLMLIYSGVRINELLNLRKEDVNLDEQYFYVRESKTEAGIRVVPIADKVLPFWKKYNNQSKCEYAVCTMEGKKLSYDNFKKRYWFPLMDQLRMNHVPHETRHTFVSLMVSKNINQTIIKKIVGHKSIMNLTERVYTHIEIKELLEAVNAI